MAFCPSLVRAAPRAGPRFAQMSRYAHRGCIRKRWPVYGDAGSLRAIVARDLRASPLAETKQAQEDSLDHQSVLTHLFQQGVVVWGVRAQRIAEGGGARLARSFLSDVGLSQSARGAFWARLDRAGQLMVEAAEAAG